MASVFITYRHSPLDSKLAHALDAGLRESGHDVFIDSKLKVGDPFGNRIQRSIEQSDFHVVLLSHEALESDAIAAEIKLAYDLAQANEGRPRILPVRVELGPDAALPYELSIYLGRLQFLTWDGAADTDSLLSRLSAAVAGDRAPRGDALEPGAFVRKPARRPAAQADPRVLATPGGAIDADSPCYVARGSDCNVAEEIAQVRGLVTVRGARQMGKTSLLIRTQRHFGELDPTMRVVYLDFQGFTRPMLSSEDRVWQAIATQIRRCPALHGYVMPQWQDELSYDMNIQELLDRVFEIDEAPVVVCMDEIDRLFNHVGCEGFFGTLRAFYNRGAMDPIWKSVRWLLSSAVEPAFFIENLNESPFNIGLMENLRGFDIAQIEALAIALDTPLENAETERLAGYLGGHPYLTHVYLFQRAKNDVSHQVLLDARSAGGGAFRDHLRRLQLLLAANRPLLDGLGAVIQDKPVRSPQLLARLEGAGLVDLNADGSATLRCRLYRDYFRAELGA